MEILRDILVLKSEINDMNRSERIYPSDTQVKLELLHDHRADLQVDDYFSNGSELLIAF